MWSNKQAHPTLLKFDRVFACVAWCDIFPHHHLRVGSSSRSDHTPLLLSTNVNSVAKKRFCFKSIWSKFPGYDLIASAWQGDVPNVDAFHTFDCKFQHTAIALKSWSAKYVGNIHMQLAVANSTSNKSGVNYLPRSWPCVKNGRQNALASRPCSVP
jgi:hypothetical protein